MMRRNASITFTVIGLLLMGAAVMAQEQDRYWELGVGAYLGSMSGSGERRLPDHQTRWLHSYALRG